jgi:hypothetical protein
VAPVSVVALPPAAAGGHWLDPALATLLASGPVDDDAAARPGDRLRPALANQATVGGVSLARAPPAASGVAATLAPVAAAARSTARRTVSGMGPALAAHDDFQWMSSGSSCSVCTHSTPGCPNFMSHFWRFLASSGRRVPSQVHAALQLVGRPVA